MKKFLLPVLALTSFVALSGTGLTSCDKTKENFTQSTIKVDSTLNGGSLSLEGLEANEAGLYTVDVNKEVTVTPKANEGYTLGKVSYNGNLLAEPYKFSATEENYVLSAQFIKNQGETGLSKVEISGTNILNVGDEASFSAKVYGASNQIIWESSDTTIATVDQTGKVTALKEGAVNIIAQYVEDSTISDKLSVFVAPQYATDFLSTITSYDYTKGITYNGEISLTLDGLLYDDNQKPVPLSIPIHLSLLKNTNGNLLNSYSYNLEFDLYNFISLVNTIKMILTMYQIALPFDLDWNITQFVKQIVPTWTVKDFFYDNGTSVAKMIFSQTGDGSCYAYLKNYDGTITKLEKVNPLGVLGNIIDTILPLIFNSTGGATKIPVTKAAEGDTGSIMDIITQLIEDPSMLNTFLTYDKDNSLGIHLNDVMTTTVDGLYKNLYTSLMASITDPKVQGLVGTYLPDGLSYIGLNFPTKITGEGASAKGSMGMYLEVKAYKGSGSDKKEYSFLKLGFSTNLEALSADYFTNIKTEIDTFLAK